ncbi:uncharacterized protein LOC134796827 [Cydia splendana]|uniref:uncharacterized protein LOC134796827 n=1 Tax=Cydia splendana TaxID=1100963 RepID=UPI0028F468BB
MTRALVVVAVLAALALVQCVMPPPPPPPTDQPGHHRRTPDYQMRLIDDYRRDAERFNNYRRRGWGSLKQLFRSSKLDLDEFDSDSSANANDRGWRDLIIQKREAKFDSQYDPPSPGTFSV